MVGHSGNGLLWIITRQLYVHRWTDTFMNPGLAVIARSLAFPLVPGFAKPGLDPADAVMQLQLWQVQSNGRVLIWKYQSQAEINDPQ